MKKLDIFTDGAFSSSRSQGGIGVVVLKDDKKVLEYSKQFSNTTNNKMELSAIIIALRCIKNPVDSITVYSDSMYCIGGITLGWKRKKNILLWKILDEELERVKLLCPNIEFKHIKGHTGEQTFESKWNDYCDKLANQASKLL